MSENITTLTDTTFDEVIGSADKPILVDFWAEWCGPCKMIAPILEEFATEQSEKFVIGKLDVDENVATATKYSVMSIPTLLLFKERRSRRSTRRRQAQGRSAARDHFEPVVPLAIELLRLGATGDRVSELHQRLAALGLRLTAGDDAVFGTADGGTRRSISARARTTTYR